MSSSTKPRRRSATARTAAIAALLVAGFLPATFAVADAPPPSLTGSDFEIDPDANLRVDTNGNLDWNNVTEIRTPDNAIGGADTSFGGGTKENTAVPTIVTGGIPPNKSDLRFFGLHQEGSTSDGFLHLYWTRVQDPSGSTNMDFELNQSRTKSANGVTPMRTVGDLLITYDLEQGGVTPDLNLRRWTSDGVWSAEEDLDDAGDASGSINKLNEISATEGGPLGPLTFNTFGEASIRLSAIFGDGNGTCRTLGSAYLKSRASGGSFNAALKDFIPPANVDISNCGSVKILKTDDRDVELEGAEFTLYRNFAPLTPPLGAEDIVTTLKCTTDANGECTILNVPTGEYIVHETVVPAGHDAAPDKAITVDADEEETVSFVDPRQRGAILITKLRKHAAAGAGNTAHAGVEFSVDGGATKETNALGQVCFDNLEFGSHTVHEVTPAGYKPQDDQTVTVNNKASCSDSPFVGETAQFVNVPLSNITVSFASQVQGGTLAKISCTGLAATPADATPGAFDDTSETFEDLEPGTYTCTVVVDP
ncbi:collagen binding domain-containing protein [Streptomyces sp. NBC_00094]|uniref:MSCRAMM family protein n=1 Tax=Streptomyces sp. NBC_00094 TaxID=2903620 RepID=UPI0022540352|nr:SpaA isopeptide-forming pilin-related protein [Streptomyces sp. NBC_00094]MCX5391072.1 prealbumin-like fold domain-containing protein [Streptomyces sp. NBC_00094]